MPIEVYTTGTEIWPNYAPFRHFPVYNSIKTFKFKVKSTHNVNIRLLSRRSYDICIGDEFNLKTSIYKAPILKQDRVTVVTPGLLNIKKFVGFWVEWKNNSITLGLQDETLPFIRLDNLPNMDVQHVCIGSSSGACATWIIDDYPVLQCNLRPIKTNTNTGLWVPANDGKVPVGAVSAGFDHEELFIARTFCNDIMMPGKLQPSHRVCYIPCDGLEYAFQDYEVLCSCPGEWIYTETHNPFPVNSVQSVDASSLKTYFIGRVFLNGAILVGKIDPIEKLCFIPLNGRELTFANYEVFVANFDTDT